MLTTFYLTALHQNLGTAPHRKERQERRGQKGKRRGREDNARRRKKVLRPLTTFARYL